MANLKPYLPKLIKDNNVKTISQIGIWEIDNVNLMKAISEGLEITAAAQKKGVSSIPDIWARPLLFQMALFDEKHPLHKQILNEWRGIVSILILSKILNLPITIEEVTLDVTSSFGRALKKLNPNKGGIQIGRPDSKIGFDGIYHWDKIFVIKLDDYPIGATSPTTLFYTAADYSELIDAPQFRTFGIEYDANGKFFTEPKDKDKVDKIKIWLEWFVKDIDANTPSKLKQLLNLNSQDREIVNLCNRIIGLFNNWYEELSSVPIDSNVYIDQDQPLITKQALPLYYNLTMVLKPKKVEYTSDLFLDIQSDNPECKKYIIINNEAFKISADPKVVQNIHVSNIKDQIVTWPKFGNRIGTVEFPDNLIWVKPEQYFLTDILLYRGKGPIIEEHQYNRSKSFILPLRPEFLKCFNSNDAILALDPQFQEVGNDFIFSINIPIKVGDKKTLIRIKRVYKDKPDPDDPSEGKIQEISAPPLIEMWPDFYDARWKRYFLFYDDAQSIAIEPMGNGLELTGEKVIEGVNMIKEFTSFPDALNINYQGEDAGVILVERKNKPVASAPWDVGIDFGTSNTNVWIKRQGQGQEQLKLTIASKKLSNSPEDSRIKLYNYFYPPSPPRIPFVSILRVYDNNLNFLYRDFAIHFIETTPTKNSEQKFKLKSNIKWSSGGNLMKSFLEHLALIVAAEAIKNGATNLTINASYPLSFSKIQQTRFYAFWNQSVLKQIKAYDNLTVNSGGAPENYTESVCTGKYFEKKLRANTTRPGAITIDVGGGTSDVCIWSDGHIKFQTSIILAGNNISDVFRKSEGICKTIFYDIEENSQDDTEEKKLKYVKILRDNIENNNLNDPDPHFASVLNYFLRRYNNKIQERIPNLFGDPYFESLIDIIMVEFAAISYYCGMVVTKMRDEEILPESSSALNLYWGGGASGFIKWLNFGMEEGEMTTELFNGVINSFSIKSDKPKLTQNPKSETAYGLITETGKDVKIASGVIIGGENFYSNNKKIEFTDEINKESIELFEGFKTENGLGEKFNDFITLLNGIRTKLGLDAINIDKYPSLSASIENAIAILSNKIKNNDQEVNLEPIFIIEVREFLREMIDKLN